MCLRMLFLYFMFSLILLFCLDFYLFYLLIIFAANRAERAVYDACYNLLLEAST